MQTASKTIKTHDFLITVNIRLNVVEIFKNETSIAVIDIFNNDIFDYHLKNTHIYFSRLFENEELHIVDSNLQSILFETAEIQITKCVLDQLKKYT